MLEASSRSVLHIIRGLRVISGKQPVVTQPRHVPQKGEKSMIYVLQAAAYKLIGNDWVQRRSVP